ncbi:DNA polymerase IV [Micromonospora sp. WMMD736]|uniref:Y-family DNA polymerase n=1 Tax=Micromonospora sp. WMMD736 TaxID=3404112 RepID=UPI003B929869
MSYGAHILHADLDAFYASVEQRDDPRLRGRPVIVGGGVVLAASYEAKARGVRSAMGGQQARRLCPDAIVVPPRMSAYTQASRLWGVGPVTAAKLRERRIRTVADVARLGEAALVSLLGAGAGRHLHALAHNRDPRAVQVGRRRGSMGAQHALGRTPHAPEELDAILASLVDRVTRRMRAAGRSGRTVVLRLRFGDYTRVTRSHTVRKATADTTGLLAAARTLLRAALPEIERRGVTLLGVSVGNLDDNPVQPELPFQADTGADLDAAVDAVRDRFGSTALTRAVLLGRAPGVEMPLLPD